MEKEVKDCKVDTLLVYSHNVEEGTDRENFVVHQIVFQNMNALLRFGEFLSIMNGSDAFDLFEVVKDGEPVRSRVMLQPFEDEHPFTQNIEEDLD